MYIVSYSERKLALEMAFRAKTDVTNAAYNDVSTLRYARSFERLQLRTSGFKHYTFLNTSVFKKRRMCAILYSQVNNLYQ